MLTGLLIVIIPLFTGYFVRVAQSRAILPRLNSISMLLLYIILFIMGMKLGVTDNILKEFLRIGVDFAKITVVLHLCNFAVLMLYDVFHQRRVKGDSHIDVGSLFDKHILFSIIKLLGTVVIGFVIGYSCNEHAISINYDTLDLISTTSLVVLIFVVGMMLGNSPDVSMKSILLNREGLTLSVIFTLSSLAGGVLLWWLWDYNLVKMLGISSGMGWYSLSSVIIARAWGPIDGSIALFVDLSRELAALVLVPVLMRRFPATAITQPGATSLDCSLPIIQKAGGIAVVPLTLSFGFLVNLYVPLLLVVFTGMPIS